MSTNRKLRLQLTQTHKQTAEDGERFPAVLGSEFKAWIRQSSACCCDAVEVCEHHLSVSAAADLSFGMWRIMMSW